MYSEPGNPDKPESDEILSLWFRDDVESPDAVAALNRLWFREDNFFDETIRRRFGHLPALAARGQLDHWRDDARSCLALVLVLDQFPRNLYRGFPQAFEYDALALSVASEAINQGFDAQLKPLEASFFYLPLEHSEDIEAQTRCVYLFEHLLARAPDALRAQFESFLVFALRHHKVIARFGRFPHRNAVLARVSTEEELAYLNDGGETFSAQGGK